MSAATRISIDSILSHRKILITCGTGGVGKTTLSAAMAIRAAMLGKRTAVITIDPAKRLATSLGISLPQDLPPGISGGGLGDQPTDITARVREALTRVNGVAGSFTGTIEAIVPDTRRTFESFVRELAPDPMVAERVMRNPIFQIFAKEFSGTNEYMALEKLFALDRTGKYDCIILDTPPSRNTLAFLDAPKLLVRFFEESLIRWLVLPANKVVAAGMRKALGILEKLTGAGFMTHLLDFAAALFEVRARFTSNLREITRMLESDNVGFVMVTVPAPDTAPEVSHFIENLAAHRFHFDGVAVNRTLGPLPLPSSAPPGYESAFDLIRSLQEREKRSLSGILAESGGIPLCARLPELARDVHTLEDLIHVAMAFEPLDGR